MKENRKYPRYGIASVAEVLFPGSDSPMDAFISSISRGGIGIYSPKKLKVGLNVEIKISFLQTNGSEEITEIIPGQVVWVKNFHQNYVVGIAFTTLDNLRHSKLISYIEAAAQGSS